MRLLLGRPVNYSYLDRTVCIQILHKASVLGVKPPKIGTPEWGAFNFRIQSYRSKGLKSSLKHLCEVHDVAYDPLRHHVEALYDVELTKAVFDKQLWTMEIESVL